MSVLLNFYRGAIESILTGNITAQDRRTLEGVLKTAQNITAFHLPSISDISEVRCLHRASRILKPQLQPVHLASIWKEI